MDYRQAVLEAPGAEDVLSAPMRRRLLRGSTPSQVKRFLGVIEDLGLGSEVKDAYIRCPDRRRSARRKLFRRRAYMRAHPRYQDLLRRLADAGVTYEDVQARSTRAEAASAAPNAIAAGGHPNIEWLEAAEALIEERGCESKPVDPVAEHRVRLEARKYYQRATPEDQAILLDLAVAGWTHREMSLHLGYAPNYFSPTSARSRDSRDAWIAKARDALEARGSVAATRPPVDPDWTEEQMAIYSAIWLTADATVATAAELFPDLNIRHELLTMRVSPELWP